MAEYRAIHTKIWQDEWFCDLDADAKLLFIYLFANPSASVAGIYEKPLKFIAFECGLSAQRTKELLDAFATADKAEYENGIVWVRHLRKYQETTSAPVQARIQKDIEAIPDSPIKRRYLAFYDGSDTVPVPYPDGTDSLSRADKDTDKDTDTETDTFLPPPPATQATPDGVAEKKPRPDQEMFAALLEVCHLKQDRLTDKTRGMLNVTGKKLRAAGLSPPDVRAFAVWYEDEWHKARAPMNLSRLQPDSSDLGAWLEAGKPPARASPNGARASPAEPAGAAAHREWRRLKGLSNGEP